MNRQTPHDKLLEVKGSYLASTILAIILILLFFGVVGSAQKDKIENKAAAKYHLNNHKQE